MLFRSTRLGPWDSPSKNTGVGRHFLLQGRLRGWSVQPWRAPGGAGGGAGEETEAERQKWKGLCLTFSQVHEGIFCEPHGSREKEWTMTLT